MHFTSWLLAGLQFHKDMLIMRSYDHQDVKLRIGDDNYQTSILGQFWMISNRRIGIGSSKIRLEEPRTRARDHLPNHRVPLWWCLTCLNHKTLPQLSIYKNAKWKAFCQLYFHNLPISCFGFTSTGQDISNHIHYSHHGSRYIMQRGAPWGHVAVNDLQQIHKIIRTSMDVVSTKNYPTMHLRQWLKITGSKKKGQHLVIFSHLAVDLKK